MHKVVTFLACAGGLAIRRELSLHMTIRGTVARQWVTKKVRRIHPKAAFFAPHRELQHQLDRF
jgi:hypothetical protein